MIDCGFDTASDGSGEIREPRLYQLIRQKGPIVDRTFEIVFLDPDVHALDFTFGWRLRGTKSSATLPKEVQK
jgi:Thioredoxin like C-terminal domain